MKKLGTPSAARGFITTTVALLVVVLVTLSGGCRSDVGDRPSDTLATPPSTLPAGDRTTAAGGASSSVDGVRHVVIQGAPGAPGPSVPAGAPPSLASGVIVRLIGPSTFEAHAFARSLGASPARTAALAHRQTLRAQHGRILGLLRTQLGGLAARRGPGLVVGAAYDDFTDVLNGVAVHGIDLATAKRILSGEADVLSIEAITQVQATLPESVPLIDADKLWALSDGSGIGIDGTGIRIGILDTGVDYTHPDLGGCFGPGCKVAGGYDFVNHDPDPMDDLGHGTHVASTAAGNGTYAGPSGPTPIRGVAPSAEIYAYKVLDASGSGFNVDIIAAIERCADPNADGDPSDHLDVCNLSLGGFGNPDDATSTAVDNATAAGVVFAIAAGNGGPGASSIGSPGTARRAITVAAACKPSSIGVDARCVQPIASFSSRGPVVWSGADGVQTLAKPDVAAPGVSICAAEWGSYQSGSRCLDGRHIALSGTSMATPHVAGVAALLRQAHPEWTPDQVKTFVVTSARDLGLDASSQGSGRIDALDALTLGGVPSSIARIGGTPLRDLDTPRARLATFASALTVTNTSGQALTFTGSFAGNPGLVVTFTPASLALEAGATGSITVIRQVDHDVVASGVSARGTITLSSARGDVHVGLEVGVRDRVTSSPTTADVGVDLASLATWTGHATVQLANTRLDSPATYTASIACCAEGAQPGGTAITASLDQTTLTLGAGASAPLGITIQASNATLANGRFDGTITLSSPLETLVLPVTFFKGYGVRIDTTPTLPQSLALSSAQSGSTVVYTVTSPSMTFLSTTPGPFFAEARWQGGNAPFANDHVLAQADTDVPMRAVTLDRAQAVYTIELRPTDQTGAAPALTWLSYRFTHSASAGGVPVGYGFAQSTKIRTSAIPAGVTFSASAFALSPDPLTYFYELPGPQAAGAVLTNAPADLVPKEMRVFRPTSAGTVPFLVPWTCLPLPYFALPNGAMSGGGATCFGGVGSSLASNVTTLRSYNSSNRDLTASPYPDAASVLFDINDGPSGATLYFGPFTNLTATHTFAWNIRWPYVNSLRLGDAVSHFACEEPPGNTLPIGPGPMIDQWTWYAHRTDVFTFRADKGSYVYPFAWGGCWQEHDPDNHPSSYRLFRDDALVASGSLTSPSALYPPVASGAHRFELTRNALIAGVTTQVESVSTFNVSSTTSVDENPPRIQALHLVAHGLWQDVLDDSAVNRLEITLDPVAGLVDSNAVSPPQFSTAADAIASITVQEGPDGVTWTDLPVAALAPSAQGGMASYRTDEITVASGPTTWLRISTSDAAGNTLRHTFQAPRGKGYAAASSDSTPPVASITAPAAGDTVTALVPVQAVASDDQGVTRVDLFVDGSSVASAIAAPYAFTWNSATVPPGAHVLTVRAYDAAENVGSSAPVSVTVVSADHTPPVVAFAAPAEAALVDGTVALAATATDDTAVVRVDFYDGAALIASASSAPYAVSWTTTNGPDGSHALRAVAFDAAGNTATASRQVAVDNTPPVVAVTTPSSGATVAGTVTVTATATDDHGVSHVDFYDGGTLIGRASTTPYAILWQTTSASFGAHRLSARAYDALGNAATSAPVDVTLSSDTTPPTVAITAPVDGSPVGGILEVSAAAADDIGVNRVEFSVGDTLVQVIYSAPYGFGWDTTGVAAGPRLLTARAFDAAGNTAISAPVRVIVDHTPPTIAITTPRPSARLTGVIPVNAVASDDVALADVTFYDFETVLGTATQPPYATTWNTFSATDGVHGITARATDVAGNHTDGYVSIVIDNSVTVSLVSPAAGARVGRSVTLTAATSNDGAAASVAFFDGSTAIGSLTAAPFSVSWSPATSGPHTLTARVVDRAGRTTTSPAITVTADLTPPTVSLTAPADGATVSRTTRVSATASDDGAVARVDFYRDGTQLLGSSTAPPYSVAWDTTTTPAGSHPLTAVAVDTLGNSATSATRTVTVSDVTAPAVTITSPATGSSVKAGSSVTIAATAIDLNGVSKVVFSVAGQTKCTVSAAPYVCKWTVPASVGKSYTLQAKATDQANNASSSTVSVTSSR